MGTLAPKVYTVGIAHDAALCRANAPPKCCVSFRLSMSPEEHSEFWRKVEFTVDRDVVRTDRSNSFFRGENNPNVEIMRCDPFRHLHFNAVAPPHSAPRPAVTFLPRHQGSDSFYIQNPREAANEFHALLTLSTSEHF